MDSTIDQAERQEISLLESLNGVWIKLPTEIMRDVGPAVQTLGGLLKMTNKETFSAVADIATKAQLPVGTVRKHLQWLDAGGWIGNRGRERTRRGRPRRTATLVITKQTRDKIKPYGILPWWACCTIKKVGKLPWSAKAVLAVIMARLAALKAAAQRENCYDEVDVIDAIENMGGEDRFRFSLDYLEQQTGLTRESIVSAKRRLHKVGIVQWITGGREDGGDGTDLLVPNWGFRVIITSASKGHCYIGFDRGSESE
ncbi:MAG: hypothetical protein L6306_17600 [Planctomycetales bacterium]|nr:hypothetical protein [Planctomycetales bacterium]